MAGVTCVQGIQGTCLIADVPVSLLLGVYVLIDFVEGNDNIIKTRGECALRMPFLMTPKRPVTNAGWLH